jgi:hypothetical protein
MVEYTTQASQPRRLSHRIIESVKHCLTRFGQSSESAWPFSATSTAVLCVLCDLRFARFRRNWFYVVCRRILAFVAK